LIALKLLSQVKAKSIQVKEAMDPENRIVLNFFFSLPIKVGKSFKINSSFFSCCHIQNAEFSGSTPPPKEVFSFSFNV